MTLMLIDEPAEAVIEWHGCAIIRHGRGPDLVETGFLQQFFTLKCGIPFCHIFDRRKQTSCRKCNRWKKNGPILKVISFPFITGCSVWNDRLWISVTRSSHSERLENSLVQKLPVRLAARLFDDHAQKIIPSVIIRPRLTGLKLQRQLEKHFEQIFSRWSCFERRIRLEYVQPIRYSHVISNTGRMSE